ncbi:MAG: hypothetical protein LBT57_00290 [Puniceicoccales bacterium]|nr:hypothetical protein [Puniceicoccales bacterium]
MIWPKRPAGLALASAKSKASDDRVVIYAVVTKPLPARHGQEFRKLERLFRGKV